MWIQVNFLSFIFSSLDLWSNSWYKKGTSNQAMEMVISILHCVSFNLLKLFVFFYSLKRLIIHQLLQNTFIWLHGLFLKTSWKNVYANLSTIKPRGNKLCFTSFNCSAQICCKALQWKISLAKCFKKIRNC